MQDYVGKIMMAFDEYTMNDVFAYGAEYTIVKLRDRYNFTKDELVAMGFDKEVVEDCYGNK